MIELICSTVDLHGLNGSTVAWQGDYRLEPPSVPVRKKGGIFMLGMQDMTIGLAWILTVASMVFGIIYGVANWNREEDEQS